MTVTQRVTTALAPILEAQVLCAEVIAGAERLQTLAATGNRELLVNECGRLGHRATSALKEFRALAAQIEARP